MKLLLKMFKEIKENIKYAKDAIYKEHDYLKMNQLKLLTSKNILI